MKTNNMRERIAFVSMTGAVKNGVPVGSQPVEHFSCWAEVPKIPIREANDPQTNVGVRTDSPTFLVRFLTDEDIDPKWLIQWRGNTYEITGLDPDFDKRDITTITAKRKEVK